MKYVPLILKNLLRKKTRLILTVGSFSMALFLFGVLAIVNHAFSAGLDVAKKDRLMVINRTSIIQPLPFSYRDRILQVPGVTAVTYANWFGGVYQDEKNFFPQYAIDVETYRSMYPEFKVADDQWKAFVADREGAIVGSDTARRFGWKIGDRVPLSKVIWDRNNSTWEFNIRGIYTTERPDDDKSQFWLQEKYFDERRAFGKGTIGWYIVKIDSPDNAVAAVQKIDTMFANSPYETKTETEAQFVAGWVKQAGNIGLLMTIIGSIVFFTLLLVIGNTMAMSVRERVRELAVMKAIGFSNGFVLFLVLAESLIVAVFGAGLGLAFSKGGQMFMAAFLSRVIQSPYFSPVMAFEGVGLALAVGFLAGLLPADFASRLRVVDALRRV